MAHQAGTALMVSSPTAGLLSPNPRGPRGRSLRRWTEVVATGHAEGAYTEVRWALGTVWAQTSRLGPSRATPTQDGAPVALLVSTTNLRAGASTKTDSAGRVVRGTVLATTGRTIGSWYEVSSDLVTGWAPASVLDLVETTLDESLVGAGMTGQKVDVRELPRDAARVLVSLDAETELMLTGLVSGDWVQITHAELTGWVPAASVRAAEVDDGLLKVNSALVPGLKGVKTSMGEHVARRFSVAPDAVLYEQLASGDWRAWLTEQLASTEQDEREWLDKLTAELPLSTLVYNDAQLKFKELKGHSPGGVDLNAGSIQRRPTTTLRALYSPRHVNEMFSQFWLDWFSLPYDGEHFPAYTIDLEIRKVAMTSFPEVFKKVYGTLAIYQFLDNIDNRRDAINENLGRETLELYSVGVGEHTEADVEQLSILLSGWSHSWDGKGYLTLQPGWHQFTPGPVRVLGKDYANTHYQEALASHPQVLHDLAHHPATVRRVCHAMAVRFVAQDPPVSLVDRLVEVYGSTGGSIPALVWAIVDSEEFAASAGARWKRPGEYIDSVHRSRQLSWDPTTGNMWDRVLHHAIPKYMAYMDLAGHRPRSWLAPDGLVDSDAYWTGSSALLQCLNVGLASGPLDPELTQTRSFAEILGVEPSMPAGDAAIRICRLMTGYVPDAKTRSSMEVVLTGSNPWSTKVDGAVRIALVSPLGFLR